MLALGEFLNVNSKDRKKETKHPISLIYSYNYRVNTCFMT